MIFLAEFEDRIGRVGFGIEFLDVFECLLKFFPGIRVAKSFECPDQLARRGTVVGTVARHPARFRRFGDPVLRREPRKFPQLPVDRLSGFQAIVVFHPDRFAVAPSETFPKEKAVFDGFPKNDRFAPGSENRDQNDCQGEDQHAGRAAGEQREHFVKEPPEDDPMFLSE